MAQSPPGLTPRQALFVEEYLLDLSAPAAAERAGYANASAGAALLKQPLVKAAVAKAIAERAHRAEVRADEVLLEIKRIALADPLPALGALTSFKSFADIPEAVRHVISAVEMKDGAVVKVKFWDKGQAQDKLMRHLGLYHDKLEIQGSVTLRDLLSREPELEPDEGEEPEEGGEVLT
jgi:phage terminase small subunit